jgi:hypothetical protein
MLANASCAEILSNGLLEIRIKPEWGRVDIMDVKRNEPILGDSRIGFSIAPYIGLDDVGPDAFETDVAAARFVGTDGITTILRDHAPATCFAGGESISMVTRMAGQGGLQVWFTLYPGKTFLEIGFAFTNLGDHPVRLRRVEVIDAEKFMPGANHDALQLLDGGSGIAETIVVRGREIRAENNVLCFFPDAKQTRALVAGGLTYADFRKHIDVAGGGLVMRADDPVGKRVDPGQTYRSADRFYLDGLTPNPFEALESYAETTRQARGIEPHPYTFPSTCMWFLAVDHFGGDSGSTNNTVGAVREMKHIVESGFLKYSPVAVRLVPDNYEPNNQQGWWDDEHWQMYGRKERCIVGRHYEKPYETTRKWASAIRELGGIPIHYFQPGIRSEDYAEAFPGHMLYNQAHKYIRKDGKKVGDPHWVIGDRGIPDYANPGKWTPGYGKLWQETYDYTDPGFLNHWTGVNRKLKDGGIQGVFYDYPDRAFAERGGFEDRHATATHAYRNVFRIAREQLGPDAYLQERIGPGSDATLEFVSSVRTAGDTNTISPRLLAPVAMRWYKNRRLTSYDMDGKALIRTGHGETIHHIGETERRSILTMSYVVSGRLLLTESFRLFSKEILHDLSRLFPFHATPLAARPLDAFVRDEPSVFAFPIAADWRQLVLYHGGDGERAFEVPISGDTAFGAMGLDASRTYLIHDFWNDRFAGRISGCDAIRQSVAAGEARMLSVHAARDHPQWISTDRHLMQGYVDLVEKPRWHDETGTLTGTSSVIGGEPYRLTLALNGYSPRTSEAGGAEIHVTMRAGDEPLADVILKSEKNRDVTWKVVFQGAAASGKP